ncbi:MAG: hypothetical protein M1817_001122 [Caeruleum heppii]|nr:MAG: hypothetical protein M1817_001122 [Caeruleum heppii]
MPSERTSTGSTKTKVSKFKPPRPSTSASAARTSRPTATDAADDDDDGSSTLEASATIPPQLLTKLLHAHFKEDGMRMSKDANAVVGKYMETFVKEALARAALERSEAAEGSMVEDLEKLAPQLLLDF